MNEKLVVVDITGTETSNNSPSFVDCTAITQNEWKQNAYECDEIRIGGIDDI